MKHEPTDIPDWDGSQAKASRVRWVLIGAALAAIIGGCDFLGSFDRRMDDGTGTPDWQQRELNDRANEQ